MDINSSQVGNAPAPGWPGVSPTWTSSAKSGVGTALNADSRIWFTVSHGIFNEVYYAREDQACIRDMGMIVTDGANYFSEEKRDALHEVNAVADGVPAYRMTNTCNQKRYTIEKVVLADPVRDSALQHTRFLPLQGKLEDYHLYVILAPHLGNMGNGNTAWVGKFKGVTMLFAQREGFALALACSAPWKRASAGFVGASDGWQDLNQHGRMEWTYSRAENGNVALTGEIDLAASNGEFVLSLGFGATPGEAGHRALSSLLTPFDTSLQQYTREWEAWQHTLLPLEAKSETENDFYRTSTAVLRTHEAKNFPGGFIASLSIPWGDDKSDSDLGGYHLVWPRDLVETAGGLLAAGGKGEMERVLHYLQTTQEPDGHWPQNMWMDGTSYWGGTQVDETALPVLILELARREDAVPEHLSEMLWPMVRKAIAFVARNGPRTDQDRWEEDSGYTAFTLASEIAALLIAADMAEQHREEDLARYLRETADAWNANIERWTYVIGTDLANRVGVEGYYVRIAPSGKTDTGSLLRGSIEVKNRPAADTYIPTAELVSVDTLALVRFGLRRADDPRIVNTVKVIDDLLKVETPFGPCWHRYNNDGYGEHSDGSPFDGTGIGRAWPLLTGERAHYELAAGRADEAEKLMHTMEGLANIGGMIPEQVWDTDSIPLRDLFFGRPSGSAMPLAWAHAEYVKLRRSLRDGRIFDMPRQTVERYITNTTDTPFAIWRHNSNIGSMPAGKTLRIEVLAQATIHWSTDGWKTSNNSPTKDTGLGIYVADLPTTDAAAGAEIKFTIHWDADNRWQGQDFTVSVV